MKPNPPDSSLPDNGLLNRRYRVGRRLGRGGMGAVFECRDTHLAEHVVAIKENSNTSPDAQEQFKREANILARLQHPNLPKVTDYFIEPSGRQYLVMDYVPGDDLERIIRRDGALSEAEALRCMAQVLAAVHYLHTRRDKITGKQQAVIHRDIKPSNIKRTADGQYILVDFGISKFGAGTATGTAATMGSMRALTPGFAPIEQYDGGTDERSDIYSLGATLYALLTLHIPPSATERSRKGTGLTSVRKYNGQLSARTEQVIERAMKVEPDGRFQTVAEMYKALIGRPIGGEQTTLVVSSGSPARRGNWLAVAAVLLVGAAVFLFTQFANRGEVVQTGAAPAAEVLAVTDPTATAAGVTAATATAAIDPTVAATADADTATADTATADAVTADAVTADTSTADTSTADTSVLIDTATTAPTSEISVTGTLTNGEGAMGGASLLVPAASGGRPPTSTPLPSPAATGTPTPTATPRPTATRSPATATAPPAIFAGADGPNAVTILWPPDGTSTTGSTEFRWQADAPLAPGQVFEVAFWQPGETPNDGRAWTAATADSKMVINPGDRAGSYRWGIWLARFDEAGNYQRLRYLGPGYSFTVNDNSWKDSPLK